jgi:uncharacterized protein (DUF1778 family)
MAREKLFTIKMTDEERESLREVAAVVGVTMADFARTAIDVAKRRVERDEILLAQHGSNGRASVR